jgi:hypothetical protein
MRGIHKCWQMWWGTCILSSLTVIRPLLHHEIFLLDSEWSSISWVPILWGTLLGTCLHTILFSVLHTSWWLWLFFSDAEPESQRRELTSPDLCFLTLKTVLISLFLMLPDQGCLSILREFKNIYHMGTQQCLCQTTTKKELKLQKELCH